MPSYKVTTGDNQLLDFDMADVGGGVFIPAKSDVELQARVGATNESAAATDTATSGLNGLTKRLLARVSTIISLIPDSLLQNTIRTTSFKGFATGTNTTTVTTASTPLFTAIDVKPYTRLGLTIENLSGSALSSLQFFISRSTTLAFNGDISSAAGSFTAANTGVGANNPLVRVIACSTNPHTIGAGQFAFIDLNVSGLSIVALDARVASGSASIRTSWTLN